MEVPSGSNIMHDVDRPTSILSGCLLSALGAMLYNILPLFLGVVQDARGYSDQQLGFLTSAYFVGFALITFSAFFWIRKVNWRITSLAMGLLTVAGLAVTTLTETYAAFVLCVMFIGTCTSALYAIGTAQLGDTLKAARNYGYKIGGEAALGAVLVFALPALVLGRWGFAGMMVAITITALFLTLSALWMPACGIKGEAATEDGPSASLLGGVAAQRAIGLCLVGIFIYFGGMSALWAFLERLGADAGHPADAIGLVLSLALIGAGAGSFLAAGIGDRYRVLSPLLVAMIISLSAVSLLAFVDGFTFYLVGACLFTLSFGFALPFMVTAVSILDDSGRFVVLTAPALALGGIAGPAIAGWLASGGGFQGVMVYTSLAVTVAMLLFALAVWRSGLSAMVVDTVS